MLNVGKKIELIRRLNRRKQAPLDSDFDVIHFAIFKIEQIQYLHDFFKNRQKGYISDASNQNSKAQ